MITNHRLDGPKGAPLVILANSLGTSAELWEPQMATLAARFRVLRYEHPGHGDTAAPPGPYTVAGLGADLLALLDGMDEQRASFVGISLGGAVALWVAAHHPERVTRLVLACTAAHFPPRQGWVDRAATVRASGTEVLLDTLLARWFPPAWLAGHPAAAEAVAAMLGATDREGYAGCCEALADLDLRSDLGAVRAPTLVIAGADDPVTPPATALELATGITEAGLVVLPGASHLANLAAPDAFTTAVVDHLAGGTVAERGDRMRRTVLGHDHVDAAAAATTPFSAPFTDLITRYAWGDIWTRPGLDLRSRSAITLAMLTVLGRHDELPMHLRGALRNGLTRDEISEILLQAGIYGGVPVARGAFGIASRVLAEEDE